MSPTQSYEANDAQGTLYAGGDVLKRGLFMSALDYAPTFLVQTGVQARRPGTNYVVSCRLCGWTCNVATLCYDRAVDCGARHEVARHQPGMPLRSPEPTPTEWAVLDALHSVADDE